MKKQKTEKLRTNKGITLIALVITIIVMLILVAVTISMAVNGGLFEYASNAGAQTNAAVDAEQELANGEIKIGKETYDSIEDYVEAANGITDKRIILTSSEQEIKFENTVTKAHVLFEKQNYQTYKILGISLEKDGEYITTGSLTGKSGKLDIVGDINNTTFVYTLTNLMKGDETFYCKIDIDGEEYIQKLEVIQGDSVIYDESYVGFLKYKIENRQMIDPTPCDIIEGETWRGGKAIRLTATDNATCCATEFNFYGRSVDLIWGQTERNLGFTTIAIKYGEEENFTNAIKTFDSESLGSYEYSLEHVSNHSAIGTCKINLSYSTYFDSWNLGSFALVIDGIRIWR